MIQELTVQDFAIISNLTIPFKEGMTVLTGETGAGKSIIIDAMGLIVGGRGSADYIRDGAEKCRIEGSFFVSDNQQVSLFLENNGIEPSDGQLVIQREIYRSGRNNCRINGQLVTTKTLREIGPYIVDIHGQNEHQELMQVQNHLHLLDQYAPEDLRVNLISYQEKFRQYVSLKEQVTNMLNNEKEFVQRMDMLTFQYKEIESAQLMVGEEESLIEERRKLMNFQKIMDSLKKAHQYLDNDELNAVTLSGSAMSEMEQIESIDDEYAETTELLRTAYYSLQEATGRVSNSLEQLEMDDERLIVVENRLDIIRQLKRKYGETVEEIISYFNDISEELSTKLNSTTDVSKLQEELIIMKNELDCLADSLSQQRHEVAKQLEKNIMKQLASLYMEQAVFKVNFSATDLTINGKDRIEFYMSTNVGESLKPLAKIVSGGELSRIMLALKTIFSATQSITSIVFDEVDTGVSGRVAQAIAEKIHQIGEQSQVLCITHLPQVAAIADTQYFIRKLVKDNRTQTKVSELSEDERIDEIARMLSGADVTDLTREHAKELLSLAKKDH
ncbi:DNA repair protein RecN [Vagococcus bubulae]|uniref:DNA repair protein RecN n=1 Tax=Vagococcus bubulae TaxID=1977868 RepID=A0A429ZMG9_9ENTE|nr:DNA repair protein RecN [Vagococcus bubulae]RST94856.1 DNA repair protein RecN [Vagococcus bubulae]